MAIFGKSSSSSEVQLDGLREIVQYRLHHDIFQTSCEKWDDWMVLVVDKDGLRMVSSALGMYDLMENRVTTVEFLEKKRAPFKDMAVIYLIAPTEESIDMVIDDWTMPDGKRLYANAVFLYFLYRVPDSILSKVKRCPSLLKRLKIFSEVNVDFLPKETRAFHLDMPNAFSMYYSDKDPQSSVIVEKNIVSKLVTLCASLNEYPYFRYKKNSKSGRTISNALQTSMDQFMRNNRTWWYHGDPEHSPKERCTFLILDRYDDVLAPLLHEFTYQAMVYDLLTVEDEKLTSNFEGEGSDDSKEILLNENDTIWVELRGSHIAEVTQSLTNRMKDFMENNKTAKFENQSGEQSNMNFKDMSDALKGMDEYKVMIAKLSQHTKIANECMKIVTRNNLIDLVELEQTLATGLDDAGKSPKLSDLLDLVKDIIPTLSPINKIRLLCILYGSQHGMEGDNNEKVREAAQLNSEENMILDNLREFIDSNKKEEEGGEEKLSFNLVSDFIFGKKLKTTNLSGDDDEPEFMTSRYITYFKTICDMMSNDSLSADDFPGTKPLPPAKTATASSVRARGVSLASRWSKDKKKKKYTGGRQVVFMVGGICYSEIRAAYEVMDHGEKEFVVGSTNFLCPDEFVDGLKDL